MSHGQCWAANPEWHESCTKRLLMSGNPMIVCDTHLCIVSIADTWAGVAKDQIVRGPEDVAALGVAGSAVPV